MTKTYKIQFVDDQSSMMPIRSVTPALAAIHFFDKHKYKGGDAKRLTGIRGRSGTFGYFISTPGKPNHKGKQIGKEVSVK